MNPLPFHHQAIALLNQGSVIAYPTEAVYGLGCDPREMEAVHRILALKQRDFSQGLILISDQWDKLAPYAQAVAMDQALKSWPGPVTWLFPASASAPKWITGNHETIALRVTDHPIAKALCAAVDYPLVSTSANPHAKPPAKTAAAVKNYFADSLDYIVDGEVGDAAKPSAIFDVVTGKQLR